MNYFLHILIVVLLYTMLASSLNLIAGFTGLMSVAHAAFYGVGAYVAALLALNAGVPFLLVVPCAIGVCCVLGAIVGIPSLRIRDDYFVIVTFAFQVIAYTVFKNWVSLTGGPMGLPGIPYPSIAGWTISSHVEFLLVAGVFAAASSFVLWRIAKSPYGRVLQAIREDETFVLAKGKNVAAYKIVVFTVGAGIAAVAGALYAYYISFIDPSSFTVSESILIISIVIIGGAGTLWGSPVGALVLVLLPEFLRFVGMPTSLAANVRQILYGGLLVLFVLFRPGGLMKGVSLRSEEEAK